MPWPMLAPSAACLHQALHLTGRGRPAPGWQATTCQPGLVSGLLARRVAHLLDLPRLRCAESLCRCVKVVCLQLVVRGPVRGRRLLRARSLAQQARKAEATREAVLCYKVRTVLCAWQCKREPAGTGKASSSLPENAGRATVGSRAASMGIGITAHSALPQTAELCESASHNRELLCQADLQQERWRYGAGAALVPPRSPSKLQCFPESGGEVG